MFRPTISSIFYNVGLDHYSKQTKVSLFIILILIPGLIAAYVFLYNRFADIIDPAPKLIPADKDFV